MRIQNVSYWRFLVKDAAGLSARLVHISVTIDRRAQRNTYHPYTSVPVIHHNCHPHTPTLYDLIAALQSHSESEDDAYIVAFLDDEIGVGWLLWEPEIMTSYLVKGVVSGDQMAATTWQEVELWMPLFGSFQILVDSLLPKTRWFTVCRQTNCSLLLWPHETSPLCGKTKTEHPSLGCSV